MISLAASLISLTRFAGGPAEGGARPLVRAAALDALRALALLPHQRLHPVRDVVLLNAGAALYCAGVTPSVAEGVRRAREAVASGAALAKLSQFVAVTNRYRPVAP